MGRECTKRVLSWVHIRQWVCSLPWGLRALVVDAFVRELLRSYRWRAKHLFRLSSVDEAFLGAVTVIQRFDSALLLNVHAHTLMLDGVYVRRADGEGITVLRLAAPMEDEVLEVAARTAKRVVAELGARANARRGFDHVFSGNENVCCFVCLKRVTNRGCMENVPARSRCYTIDELRASLLGHEDAGQSFFERLCQLMATDEHLLALASHAHVDSVMPYFFLAVARYVARRSGQDDLERYNCAW